MLGPMGPVGVSVESGWGGGGGPEELVAGLRAEGLSPYHWGNGPGDRYAWHEHPYRKVLCCLSGSIVFHTQSGDVSLNPGDRMVLEPGVSHAATVGPAGVECAEAHL
jgi:hypothetical protein